MNQHTLFPRFVLRAVVAVAGALFVACGPAKPARVTVDAEGAHYEGATYTCQEPLMAVLDKLDRDRPVQIVPTRGFDNYDALKINASLEARKFETVGLTLATGKGAWSTYPPLPPGVELKTCPSAGAGKP